MAAQPNSNRNANPNANVLDIEEEEKDEVDDLQDDEDDFLGHRSSKYHKGKPSRVELKERDLNRKTAARKKSSFDDEI